MGLPELQELYLNEYSELSSKFVSITGEKLDYDRAYIPVVVDYVSRKEYDVAEDRLFEICFLYSDEIWDLYRPAVKLYLKSGQQTNVASKDCNCFLEQFVHFDDKLHESDVLKKNILLLR